MTTTTPTEQLASAGARHAQVLARLEAARIARDDLRATLAKTRESFLSAGAAAELDGGERPSRARLTELEQQMPDAEDRIAVLERAVEEAARQVRHARADVLDEQVAGILEETTQRQARLTELGEELRVRQQEAHELGAWIANAGPLKMQQLEAEARRLRSAP
jgi:hypothetical protein